MVVAFSLIEIIKITYYIFLFLIGLIIVSLYDISEKIKKLRLLLNPVIFIAIIILQTYAANVLFISFVRKGSGNGGITSYTLNAMFSQVPSLIELIIIFSCFISAIIRLLLSQKKLCTIKKINQRKDTEKY